MLAKNIVGKHTQTRHLIIINAHDQHAILSEQFTCQHQARVHHAQPIRMESARSRRVLLKSRASLQRALSITRASLHLMLTHRLCELVRIHKIMTRVIRRINVHHLHLATVRRAQSLQSLQVLALNKHIAGRFPIHRIRKLRMNRSRRRQLRHTLRLTLTRPSQTKLLSTPPARFSSPRRFCRASTFSLPSAKTSGAEACSCSHSCALISGEDNGTLPNSETSLIVDKPSITYASNHKNTAPTRCRPVSTLTSRQPQEQLYPHARALKLLDSAHYQDKPTQRFRFGTYRLKCTLLVSDITATLSNETVKKGGPAWSPTPSRLPARKEPTYCSTRQRIVNRS